MPVRQAACDPCRISKLACDHARPSCGRCSRRNQAASCTYRSRPFVKRPSTVAVNQQEPITPQVRSNVPANNVNQVAATDGSQHYPNPGYQGHFSHTTIFGQLPPVVDGRQEDLASTSTVYSSPSTRPVPEEVEILRGKLLLEEIYRSVSVRSCIGLVDLWLAKGLNLALAGPFVKVSAQTMERLFDDYDDETQTARRRSEHLFRQSASVVILGDASTLDDFCYQFCFNNARWETLGLFFTAVSMATIDIARQPEQFTSQKQRQHLRKLALRFADQCLALSLTLDCLNDLQLILQYENFINHSCTNGDQSFDSWKRLGDIVSSIYALGYHEQNRTNDNCPKFLKHIREAVFAFTYSADKNVSIFLGRPPRMQRKYCDFDFLQHCGNRNGSESHQTTEYLGWNVEQPFDYMAEAWWSVTCALQKEEVLQVFREKNPTEKSQKASIIKAEAQNSWLALPPRFRLAGKVMPSSHSPIERDFLASARLNHLHVLFLLQLSLSSSNIEPVPGLLVVSAEILSLVTEETMIREHLVNSGTGLIWRIAYYGLPAAGILCLALLNGVFQSEGTGVAVGKVFQDLGVLVAQVESGGLIDSIDPNYALLVEATETIKGIIGRMLQRSVQNYSPGHLPMTNLNSSTGTYTMEMWAPWIGDDAWDFETPFWSNLAEHPSLIAPDNSCNPAIAGSDTVRPING